MWFFKNGLKAVATELPPSKAATDFFDLISPTLQSTEESLKNDLLMNSDIHVAEFQLFYTLCLECFFQYLTLICQGKITSISKQTRPPSLPPWAYVLMRQPINGKLSDKGHQSKCREEKGGLRGLGREITFQTVRRNLTENSVYKQEHNSQCYLFGFEMHYMLAFGVF